MAQQKTQINPVSTNGTYVKNTKGHFTLTSAAILRSETIETMDVRVKTSTERDVSASLDGRTGYVKEVYLKFKNGEIATSFAIEGCVLEYRGNAGAGKTFSRGGRKWEGTYLKTYACLGIPVKVLSTVMQKLTEENKELDWDQGESIMSEKDGYYWPTVKLQSTPGEDTGFICLALSNGNLTNFDPVSLMAKNHKSLVGVAMFSMRLKKVAETPKSCRHKQYTVGITLTSFQCVTQTTIKGPGITESMPSVGFKDYSMTAELAEAISEISREDDEEDGEDYSGDENPETPDDDGATTPKA